MREISATALVIALGEWRPTPAGADVAAGSGAGTGSRRPGATAGAYRPGYRRLADALRGLILDGRLPLGVRLPGERELARALGVSRTTVTAAYATLREAGHAESRQGSGTWTTVPGDASGVGSGGWTPVPRSTMLDLSAAAPAAPGPLLRAAFDRALELLPVHLDGHGYEPLGLPDLRAAVADRFTARGLPTTPDQVLITNGAQQATSLVLAVLGRPGERLLLEHPTYPNVVELARGHQRMVPVPFTDSGWDVDAIAAAVRQTAPSLAYLVPDFQNPTGLLMPTATRHAVAEVLARGRVLTIVDETLVDLPLGLPLDMPLDLPRGVPGPDDGRAVGATHGAMPPPFAAVAPGAVVTVGSLSKSVWGGLRVGWARADAALVRRLAAHRSSLDAGTPVVEQLAASVLVRGLDEHLPARWAELAAARDLLLDRVERRLPTWRVRRPAGGLVAWFELPEPRSSALVHEARRHGVRLVAGPRFAVDAAFERFVRLPYSLPPDLLVEAVERIVPAWAAATGHVAEHDGPGPL